MSIEDIRKRDAEAAVTWFTGPASFPAQAARDRRDLLAEIDRLNALLPQQPAVMKVEINGESFVLGDTLALEADGTISYEGVALAVGMDPAHNPSMVYYGCDQRSGVLTRGRRVQPEDGMRFVVAVTGAA